MSWERNFWYGIGDTRGISHSWLSFYSDCIAIFPFGVRPSKFGMSWLNR